MAKRMSIKEFKGGLFAGKGPTPLEPSEALISKAIADFLDAQAGPYRLDHDRINSGRIEVVKKYFDKRAGQMKEFRHWLMLAKKGTPDRYFIFRGRIVYIEVKRRGKKPTEDQLVRHDELRRAGARIIVADSIDSFIRQADSIIREILAEVKLIESHTQREEF